MGHKIFISYKYADDNVKKITNNIGIDTARQYVDEIERYIENYSEHIFKAEKEGESLEGQDDEKIWELLKNKIFDSTLTIVIISAGMKEKGVTDRDQWIPWEIAYSLREVNRKDVNGNDRESKTSAILAVVLPDRQGKYQYFIEENNCCATGCRTLKTDNLFNILKKNMFNELNPNKESCDNGKVIYHGNSSYIYSVKWADFITDPERYINIAYDLLSQKSKFDIKDNVNC